MKKVCSSCKKERKDFYKKSNGKLHSWCIECYSKNRKGKHDIKTILKNRAIRRQERQEFVLTYLMNNPCIKCGENDPRVLQFDHRDPKTKQYNVSTMVNQALSKKLIKTEIDKCDVLCANCHTRKTSYQSGNYKNKPWALSLMEKTPGYEPEE